MQHWVITNILTRVFLGNKYDLMRRDCLISHTYVHLNIFFFNGIHNSIYTVVWFAIIMKCNANIWQLNATPR